MKCSIYLTLVKRATFCLVKGTNWRFEIYKCDENLDFCS